MEVGREHRGQIGRPYTKRVYILAHSNIKSLKDMKQRMTSFHLLLKRLPISYVGIGLRRTRADLEDQSGAR